MNSRILVINPNSSIAVTQGIDEAAEPLRLHGGPLVECTTLREGPPGIETQAHVESVVLPLCRLIAARDAETDAFVIACYSDPGLHAARETTRKPVLGIAESGIFTALTLGQRLGVIAILATSIPRHLRYIAQLGISGRLAHERAVGLGVAELADEARALQRLIDVGTMLRDNDGADVLVMGCAGMARYRERLQDAVRIPVVEPTQAAIGMAVTRVRLGW